MSCGDASAPLVRYAGSAPGAAVRLSCATCGSGHAVEVARVIWFLKAFGLGDELSPVAEAARLARNPCVRCGHTAWLAHPVRPAPPRPSA